MTDKNQEPLKKGSFFTKLYREWEALPNNQKLRWRVIYPYSFGIWLALVVRLPPFGLDEWVNAWLSVRVGKGWDIDGNLQPLITTFAVITAWIILIVCPPSVILWAHLKGWSDDHELNRLHGRLNKFKLFGEDSSWDSQEMFKVENYYKPSRRGK